MRRPLCMVGLILLLVGGCIEELEGFLYFNWNTLPPDTTSQLTVTIAGEVVRTPPRQNLTTIVTAVGAAQTVVDTTSGFGLFSLDIPLVTDATNEITITAGDNTGATSPNPGVFVVVQRGAPPASRASSPAPRATPPG